MNIPRQLFLNVCRDSAGKVWGVARVCLNDGSCLVIESRVYKSAPGSSYDGAAIGDDGEDEPRNMALDEALDKLCKLTKNKAVMRAIPAPARLAIKLVCTARNLRKIQEAAENEGDEELAGLAHRKLRKMERSENELAQRAHKALRLWA